jgi:hypothetical protein
VKNDRPMFRPDKHTLTYPWSLKILFLFHQSRTGHAKTNHKSLYLSQKSEVMMDAEMGEMRETVPSLRGKTALAMEQTGEIDQH